jgi:hypothetical protein
MPFVIRLVNIGPAYLMDKMDELDKAIPVLRVWVKDLRHL